MISFLQGGSTQRWPWGWCVPLQTFPDCLYPEQDLLFLLAGHFICWGLTAAVLQWKGWEENKVCFNADISTHWHQHPLCQCYLRGAGALQLSIVVQYFNLIPFLLQCLLWNAIWKLSTKQSKNLIRNNFCRVLLLTYCLLIEAMNSGASIISQFQPAKKHEILSSSISFPLKKLYKNWLQWVLCLYH